MRIIHVTDELMPHAGGLVSVPINLAAAQAALGHEVLLIGRTGKDILESSNETASIPHFDKVQLEDCHNPGRVAKVFPVKSLACLKKHITLGSIVHLHGAWDPILFFASKIARKVGASYVVTPHSMLHPWQMKRYVWQKKVVFALGWRKMFQDAAFIHVLNADEKKYVDAFHFGRPAEIIPNGIYPEVLAKVDHNPFLQKNPELKGKPYILFLSRLHYQKGIAHLLDGFEAFAKMNPDVHLVLAGPDYGELAVINEKLKQMQSVQRVLLPGPLYGDQKVGALYGASCFALTSLNEGFSVAILEAMACGLPVVISTNCYFPEVEEAGVGVITQMDAKSISLSFSAVMSSPSKARRMGLESQKFVAQNYHWNAIAKRTEVLYVEHTNS